MIEGTFWMPPAATGPGAATTTHSSASLGGIVRQRAGSRSLRNSNSLSRIGSMEEGAATYQEQVQYDYGRDTEAPHAGRRRWGLWRGGIAAAVVVVFIIVLAQPDAR